MNPTEIKLALSSLGGRANKKLGQHFLIDPAALQSIVDAADIQPNDRVLEIGPGLGVLTGALIERGASIIAIEQDRRFIEYLTDLFLTPPSPLMLRGGSDRPVRTPLTIRGAGALKQNGGKFHILHGDAARLDWNELVGDSPWKFVSNLPYSITSLALRKALWSPRPPSKVVVLVQREVAERAIANSSPSGSPSVRGRAKTSLLSLMVALASRSARIVKRVPAGAFYPPPKVESAILSIDPLSIAERQKKWGIDPERVMSLAKRGFAHPRKFLASNLGLADPSILESIGLDRRVRAEDLSPEQWVELTKGIKE